MHCSVDHSALRHTYIRLNGYQIECIKRPVSHCASNELHWYQSHWKSLLRIQDLGGMNHRNLRGGADCEISEAFCVSCCDRRVGVGAKIWISRVWGDPLDPLEV